MADLGTLFDAHAVEPAKAYEVLPAGKYLVQIVASEMRPTRDGLGQYLHLGMDVLEGSFQGRKLFDQLNLVNGNNQTVEIAQRTLSAICHATGRMQVQDSEDLHLIPMQVAVTVEAPKNGYGEKNRIRYLVPEQGTPAPAPRTPAQRAASQSQPRQAAQPAPAPAAKPNATAPWNRA